MLSTLEKTPARELVERIQSGDRQAENLLISTYWKGMFFVLNKQAQNPDLAQDIAQDTFELVLTKIRRDELKNPDALAGFIRQIGVNLLIAYYRKQTRQNTHSSEETEWEFPDKQKSIPEQLNEQQLLQLVEEVMNELPTERDREVLQAYFVAGQSKESICTHKELTAAHFDRVLYRAKARLKEKLQIKLGVDTQHMSLQHLLGAALLAISSQGVFFEEVRGFSLTQHKAYTVEAKIKKTRHNHAHFQEIDYYEEGTNG